MRKASAPWTRCNASRAGSCRPISPAWCCSSRRTMHACAARSNSPSTPAGSTSDKILDIGPHDGLHIGVAGQAKRKGPIERGGDRPGGNDAFNCRVALDPDRPQFTASRAALQRLDHLANADIQRRETDCPVLAEGFAIDLMEPQEAFGHGT